MINYVVKRNGEKVPFDANKINQWMEWSTSIGVDWTDIALEAYRKCFDGCSTQDIQQSLITACLDKADTNHLKMAGRHCRDPTGTIFRNKSLLSRRG